MITVIGGGIVEESVGATRRETNWESVDMSVCVCVCVCVREREREIERGACKQWAK